MTTLTSAPILALDPHSFARIDEAVVQKLYLDIKVDFSRKIISGKAQWTIKKGADATAIHFDTKGLTIQKVTLNEDPTAINFSWGIDDVILGHELIIPLKATTVSVSIYYSTSPDAAACQWLESSQTAGKKLPFLFTQCQAILGRSLYPCQDSPGIRFTYEADVQVPTDMLALMSAENPTQKNATGKYHFRMTNPIPSYLMALAVGDIQFQSLGERTGVYAEPSMLEKSAYEFADMQKMLEAAEKLYGPYRWGKYDVLVLPPSFPFGGMENPRLTFATPTILAGDRSLVSLVSHELAHSWSGNLVTNANWNDFWLNEGFTVYFERRITEALYGKDFADMEAYLGMEDLKETLKDFENTPDATCLKLKLDGKDPDDGMNSIAYEKGYALLLLIEKTIGRDALDAFLRKYFDTHAFQTMNTEQFISYIEQDLFSKFPGAEEKIKLNDWIYKPGLPANCPVIVSEKFIEADREYQKWMDGAPAKNLNTGDWTTQQWLNFIDKLPTVISNERMIELDAAFKFSVSGNAEIADAWFLQSLIHNYSPAYIYMEKFLIEVGRRKFLMPLYKEMIKSAAGKELAMKIYKQARPNYHFVARQSVDEMLGWHEGL
ncbi:aminopeptidase [Bacteroidota bacterium]|nr:aminopeptidase [Bacteroidota bacterium]